MSLTRRLILWLALLGMVLHAPWPQMAHGQVDGQMADMTICSASGMRVVPIDEQTHFPEDAPGSHHSLDDALCCLVCADPGNTNAVPHAPFAFLPHLTPLGLARPALQRNAYQPPGLLRATARAPPLA